MPNIRKKRQKVCQLIIDHQAGSVFIVLPWNSPFVGMLVSKIKLLHYNLELNACEAPIEFANLIEHLAGLYFDEIIIDEYEQDITEESSNKQNNNEQDNNPWINIRKLLTQEDIRSIRKLLSKKYHPDNNSKDLTIMSQLNVLFDKLEKEYK